MLDRHSFPVRASAHRKGALEFRDIEKHGKLREIVKLNWYRIIELVKNTVILQWFVLLIYGDTRRLVAPNVSQTLFSTLTDSALPRAESKVFD